MPPLEQLENQNIWPPDPFLDGVVLENSTLTTTARITYDELQKHCRALIATEDERYYDHAGIVVRTLRAIFTWEKKVAFPYQQLADSFLEVRSRNKKAIKRSRIGTVGSIGKTLQKTKSSLLPKHI